MADTQNKQFELGEETGSSQDEWDVAKEGSNENEREDNKYIYYRKSVEPTQENLREAKKMEEKIKEVGLMSEDDYKGKEGELEGLKSQITAIEIEENKRNEQIEKLNSEAETARESANEAKAKVAAKLGSVRIAEADLDEAKQELKNARAMSTKTKVNSNDLTFEQFMNLKKAYDTSYEMAKNSSNENELVPNDKGNVFEQALNRLNVNNKNIRNVLNSMETTWGELEKESGKGNVSLSDVAKKIAEGGIDFDGNEYKEETKVLELLNNGIDIANKDIEAANAINAEANILHSRRLMNTTRGDVAILGKEASEDGLFKGTGLNLNGNDSKTYMQDTAKKNNQEESVKGYEKYVLYECNNKDKKLNQYEEDLENNLMNNYFNNKNIKGEIKSVDETTKSVNTTLKDSVSIQTRNERMRKEFESSKDFKGNPYNIPSEGEDLNKCIDYLKKKREKNEKTSFMSSLSKEQQNQYNTIKSKIGEEEKKRQNGEKNGLSDRAYANLLYISDCFVRSVNVAKNIESVRTNITQFQKSVEDIDKKVIYAGIETCGNNKYNIGVFKRGEDGQLSCEKKESIDTTSIVNDSNANTKQTIKSPLTQINNNLALMKEETGNNLTKLYNIAIGGELRANKSDTINSINGLNKEFDNYSILNTRFGNIQNVVQQKSVEIGKSTVEIEDKDKVIKRNKAIEEAKKKVEQAQANFNNAGETHNSAKKKASNLEAEAKAKEDALKKAQEEQEQIGKTKAELETERDKLDAIMKEEDAKRVNAENLKKEAEALRTTQYKYIKREKKEVPEKTKTPDKTGDGPSAKKVGERSGGGNSGGNGNGNTGNGNNKIHIGMADGTGDTIEGWNGGIDYMANLYSRLALNDSNNTTRAGIYVSNIEQANRELVEKQMSFIRQNNDLTLGQMVGTFYNGQNIGGQKELLSLINSYPNTSINDLMNAGLLSQDNVRSLLESVNNDLARENGRVLAQNRDNNIDYDGQLTTNTEASHSATITATYLQANGGSIDLRDVINDDGNLENRLNVLENNFNAINSKSNVAEQAESIRKEHPEYTQTMTNRVKYGEKINKFNTSHYKTGNNLDPSNFSEGYKKATEEIGVYMVYDEFKVEAKDSNSPATVTFQTEKAGSKLTFESKDGPFNMADFANESGRYKGNLDAFIKTQERNIQNKGGEEAKNAPVCSMDESFKIGDTSLKNASDEELQEFIRNVAAQDGKWSGTFPPSAAQRFGKHIDNPELGARIVEAAKKNMIEENKKKDKNKQLTDEQIEQQCTSIEQAFWQGREERNNYIVQNQLQGYNTEMPARQQQTNQQTSVQQQTQQTAQMQQQPTSSAQEQSNQQQQQSSTKSNNGSSIYGKGQFNPNPGNIPYNSKKKQEQSVAPSHFFS